MDVMDTSRLLRTALSPLSGIATVLGAFPFKINHRLERPVYSYLPLVICSLLMASVFSTLWVALPFVFPELEKGPSFDATMEKVTVILDPLVLGIMLVTYQLRIQTFSQVFSEMFQCCRLVQDASYYRKVFWWLLVQILITHIVYLVLQFYDSVAMLSDQECEIVLLMLVIMILRYYLTVHVTVMGLLFANTLFLLHKFFNVVNTNLEKLEDSKVLSMDKGDWSLERSVLEARRQHDQLSRLAGRLNDCCGLPLAAFSLGILLSNLLTMFFFLTQTPDWVQFVVTMLNNSVQLVMVLTASQMVTKEASRTGIIVHTIMTQSKDRQFRRQLQEFSLQLLHHNVKFTAFGLYPLDFSFVYTMGAAIATYLVILIQFQTAAHDPKNLPVENTTETQYDGS